MTDSQEEVLRSVAAESLGTTFIVELLLAQYLKTFPPEHREEIAASILSAAAKTDQYRGMTRGDDELSEIWADIVVRMHSVVENMLARALLRLDGGAGPGSGS